MSRSQLLVLLGILVLFVLWRRARRQVEQARAGIEEHRARNSFTFEATDGPSGRGFVVSGADGRAIDPRELTWSDHGLEVISAEAAPGMDPGELLPGTEVELIEEADRFEIWNRAMTVRLARLDAGASAETKARADAGEVGACIVLRQPDRMSGRIELLLLHAGVDVDL